MHTHQKKRNFHQKTTSQTFSISVCVYLHETKKTAEKKSYMCV